MLKPKVEVKDKMKKLTRIVAIFIVVALVFALPSPVSAADTDWAGANWTISTNTTISGVQFNINTFTIDAGVTVTVSGSVEIHAQTVDINGTLTATGQGNGADTGTGAGTAGASKAGAGGGGYGGTGGDGDTGNAGGGTYGSDLAPIELGSGGGTAGGQPGGSGGGVIIIHTIGTLTIGSAGVIEADGTAGLAVGNSAGGGGSGGSIYITAATFAGGQAATTHIHADGGAGGGANYYGGGGGGGRIAIHYTTSTYAGLTSASGGAAGGGTATAGAAGTDTTDDILWRTYKDSGYVDDEDVFDDYSTEHIVYVDGTGFANGGINYTIVFWDAVGAKIQVATGQAGPGLSSQRTFSEGPQDPLGTWYTSVYPNGLDPASHSTTTNLKADYAFKVDAAAIPEFPTVIAAIMVAGLCFGIYYWMRKRYQMVEVYTKNVNRLGGKG